MDKKIYSIDIDEQTINDSIDKYGPTMQAMVCMEECAELAQAISKCIRYGDEPRIDNLKEEMADTLICIIMAAKLFNVEWSEVTGMVAAKQERTRKRL